MSGIEEKPIKEELSLRAFRAFDSTFEGALSVRDRRRERRHGARIGIVIYSICVVVNLIAAAMNFIVGNWIAVLHVILIVVFSCWLNRDIQVYIENTDIGRIQFVRN